MMAYTDSNPFSITIANAPTTVLATCAAALPPGTWKRFDGSTQYGVAWPAPANQTKELATDPYGVVSIMPYINKMPWNPVHKRIHILAQDHAGAGESGLILVHYDEATHSWLGYGAGSAAWIDPRIGGHGYDHLAANPHTGQLFHKLYGGTSSDTSTLPSLRSPIPPAQATWTSVPNSGPVQWHTNGGTFWWSGSFTAGAGLGAHGGWGIYSRRDKGVSIPPSPTDGSISLFDPLTDSWAFQMNGASPNINVHPTEYEYNAVAAYSPVKNVAVYGGGVSGNERRMWKLTSNGTVTELTTAPLDIGIHMAFWCCDPVTGNFLAITGTSMYELNPDGAGTWTAMTGSRVPPDILNGFPMDQCYACVVEIATHNVIAVVQERSSTSRFWLYKHA